MECHSFSFQPDYGVKRLYETQSGEISTEPGDHETMKNETRVLANLPHDEYLALDALSSSGAKDILRSPAFYRWRKDHPSEPTPSMVLGTALHMAVLEPERFERTVVVDPGFDRRTKPGKADAEQWASNLPPEALILQAPQMELVRGMQGAIEHHPYAARLLDDIQPELSILWDADGVQCKARLDALGIGHNVLIDIKTSSDASWDSFAKSAANFGYHIQAAHYIDGAKAAGYGKRTMLFVVVENTPPHQVAVYVLDDEAVRAGEVKMARARELYLECVAQDQWPGYQETIQVLSLPKWAL